MGDSQVQPTFALEDGTWTGYLRDASGNPVLSALTPDNERSLAALAKSTGGKMFRAAEGSAGIASIRRLMRGMKQQEHRARKVQIAEDRYALVLLLAFRLRLPFSDETTDETPTDADPAAS